VGGGHKIEIAAVKIDCGNGRIYQFSAGPPAHSFGFQLAIAKSVLLPLKSFKLPT
jgi:hypothetical protein